MYDRCTSKNSPSYKYYGGRGIKVCERWRNFVNFRDDMHEAYLKHVELKGEKQTTIDRINNDGNYEPSNCRWADYKTQVHNSRRYFKK